MKSKDYLVIVLVAILAGVFSMVASSMLFVGKASKELKAETASSISSEFKKPDDSIFNSNAINPTQLIQIGDNNNPKPL